MSNHTDIIVDAYMEDFSRSDKPAMLALLTDESPGTSPGFRHLTGKAVFEGGIVNPSSRGHRSRATEWMTRIEHGRDADPADLLLDSL